MSARSARCILSGFSADWRQMLNGRPYGEKEK